MRCGGELPAGCKQAGLRGFTARVERPARPSGQAERRDAGDAEHVASFCEIVLPPRSAQGREHLVGGRRGNGPGLSMPVRGGTPRMTTENQRSFSSKRRMQISDAMQAGSKMSGEDSSFLTQVGVDFSVAEGRNAASRALASTPSTDEEFQRLSSGEFECARVSSGDPQVFLSCSAPLLFTCCPHPLTSHFLCLFKSVSLPFDLVYVCECNFGDGCNYALSSSTSLPVQLQR